MLDTRALFSYLAQQLPGFECPEAIEVRQFVGGQSNPTYSLTTPAGRYVLRKKPAGKLVPSAHAIEREYAVMRALAGQVPVPSMHLLCEDEGVIGQAFYLMDHVEGRLLPDARMLDAPREERRSLTRELVSVLARLHNVDYQAIGLDGFGKAGGYVARQLARLSQQYEASRIEDNADMELVIGWLADQPSPADETTIVHGDYRSYNVLYASDAPHIAAVLDWELATRPKPSWSSSIAAKPDATRFPTGAIFSSSRCFAARRSAPASTNAPSMEPQQAPMR
jgi:aminoglycoside phosphotransferase (APT) family kinase protein